jgi:ATP-binding cassette, subfamily B, bacterial
VTKSARAKIPLRQYGRALQFVRPYKLQFVPLFLLSFFSTAVTLAQPYLTKLLIDDALQHHSFRSLTLFAFWMGVCAGLSFGLGILTTYLYTKLSAAILFDMRLAAFQKLQRLSPQFFTRTKTGDIVSRLNNDIGELQRLSADTVLSLPSNLLFLVGNAAMMVYLNAGLALISVAMLPLGIWAMQRYQGRLRQQVKTMREYSAEIGSFLIEAILGMRVLVSSNAQERKNEEFRGHNKRFVDSLLSMQATSFLAGALPGAVITLSVAVLFLYGGSLVIRNVITLGSLMAFMAYHGRLLSPIQSLMGSYSALVTGSVSLTRVFELLDQPEDVREKPGVEAAQLSKGRIDFREVSFGYNGRENVLQELSFSVDERSICVLVGASGAGKSTLIDLLLRFYDPKCGSIQVDGRDLTDLRLHDLRQAVAVVEQTPFFFHASVSENLRFAAPEANSTDMLEAARRAGIGDYLDSLPAQYDTLLGERGLALSAGQRQRLAIARALLRKPSILVLDEPSAALDPQAEFQLGETLGNLSETCTVLIVTHRPALAAIADQVVLIEKGRVVETGRPSELSGDGSALSRHFRESLQSCMLTI